MATHTIGIRKAINGHWQTNEHIDDQGRGRHLVVETGTAIGQ